MICPTCEGDGIERCNNPDHGFINALGLKCPACGYDEQHKIVGCKCPDCDGTGNIDKEEK